MLDIFFDRCGIIYELYVKMKHAGRYFYDQESFAFNKSRAERVELSKKRVSDGNAVRARRKSSGITRDSRVTRKFRD
jgi:hypothetical protein